MGGPLSLAPQKEENVITEALIRQCKQVVLCYCLATTHLDYRWFACQTGSPKKQPKEEDLHGLEGSDIAKPNTQQQPQTVGYKDIQHLAFGFRHIVEIDHLHGLVNLKKLQLDNNCLTKIENLDHLVCKPSTR